jgi:hypothetical protein
VHQYMQVFWTKSKANSCTPAWHSSYSFTILSPWQSTQNWNNNKESTRNANNSLACKFVHQALSKCDARPTNAQLTRPLNTSTRLHKLSSTAIPGTQSPGEIWETLQEVLTPDWKVAHSWDERINQSMSNQWNSANSTHLTVTYGTCICCHVSHHGSRQCNETSGLGVVDRTVPKGGICCTRGCEESAIQE